MSTISKMLLRMNDIQTEEHLFTTKKIHIFYEGAVTEKEIITLFVESYNKHPELFNYFKLSMITPSTTSYKRIKEVLDDKFYYDDNNDKVYIFEDDYITFIFDLDFIYDFKKKKDKANYIRVLTERKRINEFVKELKNDYSDYNFYFTPSFPAIEYAIALGLDENLENISCVNNAHKEVIFEYFDVVNGYKTNRRQKSFNGDFYNSGKFNLRHLITNSYLDRINKRLPKEMDKLDNYIKNNKVESLLKINRPFTYLDNINTLAKTIIVNLYDKVSSEYLDLKIK